MALILLVVERFAAQEIADLYKRRWAIELFFRWVKQNLKIGHFLGTSKNAVRIQIAVALIAYLLLSLARQACTAIASPSSSPGWCATTSCIAELSTISKHLTRHPRSPQTNSPWSSPMAKPDSRGRRKVQLDVATGETR